MAITRGALKKMIREELKKRKIKEANVSTGAGAYLIPKAFKGSPKK